MKKTMVFAIVALAAIILAAAFGVQLSPSPVTPIPANAAGTELYVCPAASSSWNSISQTLRPYTYQIIMAFFFATVLLLFFWGWAMYQNLLKDKFDRKSFSKSWGATKILFWAGIIMTLLIYSPNHFRVVKLVGASGDYVLCDNNTPGNRAVRASAVIPK